MITQKQILMWIRAEKVSILRATLGRTRLRFSLEELSFFLFSIAWHNATQRSFKSLWRLDKRNLSYEGFMKNVQTASRLWPLVFKKSCEAQGIRASNLYNVVDTTLLEEKLPKFIRNIDYRKERVTSRSFRKEKVKICGSKGLVFMNRDGQVFSAKLLPINFSDHNVLKDFSAHLGALKGLLLADRGFHNKAVVERLSGVRISAFGQSTPACRLISPPHPSQKKRLSPKEARLYKRRWAIETLFQSLKYPYSNVKLNLRGSHSKSIKSAKFFAALTLYNLSK